MWWLLLSVAWGSDGVNPTRVPLLDNVVFRGPDWGWEADVDGDGSGQPPGRVRVHMAPDASTAERRFATYAKDLPSLTPLFGARAMAGYPGRLLVVMVDGCVLKVDRPAGEALDLVRRLLEQVESLAEAWPRTPRLERQGDVLTVVSEVHDVRVIVPPAIDAETMMPLSRFAIRIGDDRWRLPSDAGAVRVWVWDRWGRGVETVVP